MTVSLSKITALEAALEYLVKAETGEEQREYDPEGFHEGPRHGHYFRPGEREVGGKEVDVVQAPADESPELDLTERLPSAVDKIRPEDVPQWLETPDGARAMGDSIPRYWWHQPPGHVAEGTPSGGLQAYNMDPTEIETTSGFYSDKLGHPRPTEPEQFIWLSPVSRRGDAGTEFVIDITKLKNDAMRFTGQAEGNLLHRGDISPDGIASRPDAEAKTDNLSKSFASDSSIRIGNLDIPVEIATDPIAGLSGRDSLVPGTGMLFDLDGHPVITMKDMKFPLDLVWMAGGRVVDLTENALVPVLGQESVYIPEAHATAVLEINGVRY